MRILIAGAGAVGGYFGGRLIQSGADVTFMVRERRAQQLQQHGLVIRSSYGGFVSKVPFIRWTEACDPFDAVIICCKAFDLAATTAALTTKITADATVLPLLNGIAHLEYLDAQLSSATILGGTCHMGVTLDTEGSVIHLNRLHSLTFGARNADQQQACDAMEAALMKASFNVRRSEHIQQEMWEKWMFLAALASITCLMRGSIGDIVRTPHGARIIKSLLNETCAVASAAGFAPRPEFLHEATALLLDPASSMTASMLRDIEKGSPTEADHIIGDMARRGQQYEITTPLLEIALTHLQVYETVRQNMTTSAG